MSSSSRRGDVRQQRVVERDRPADGDVGDHEQPDGQRPVALADHRHRHRRDHAQHHEDRQEALLVRTMIGNGAEHRRHHGADGQRDGRPHAEVEGRRLRGEPLGGDVVVVDRKHRRDDRGQESRVRPVVERPRAQLRATESEALQPGRGCLAHWGTPAPGVVGARQRRGARRVGRGQGQRRRRQRRGHFLRLVDRDRQHDDVLGHPGGVRRLEPTGQASAWLRVRHCQARDPDLGGGKAVGLTGRDCRPPRQAVLRHVRVPRLPAATARAADERRPGRARWPRAGRIRRAATRRRVASRRSRCRRRPASGSRSR